MLKLVATAVCIIVSSSTAFAQHVQPYAGLEQREVKGLSKQQIVDLQTGRGMGLALPAELNGYPGPLHVLELADKLELSNEQRTRTLEFFDLMKAEAISLGERLIREETDLDRQFATKAITPQSLAASTAAIGSTQAELRYTHLK